MIEVLANKWALYVLAALRRYGRPMRFSEQGYRHPLLTLELGIAFHQAMINVCADFERHSQARC